MTTLKKGDMTENNKVISFFNKEGRITSIENYANNQPKKESQSYKYLNDFSRVLISQRKKTDTLVTENFKILDNGTRLITSKSKKTLENNLKTTTIKEQKFDSLFKLKEVIEETLSLSDGMSIKFNLMQTYFYEDKKLKEIRGSIKQEVNNKALGINDRKENENRLFYQNEKFDEIGNLIYRETVDGYRNVVLIEERTYEYY